MVAVVPVVAVLVDVVPVVAVVAVVSVSPRYQVVSNQNAVDCNQVWIGSYPSLSRFVPKPLVKSFIYPKYLTHERVNRYQSLRRTSW